MLLLPDVVITLSAAQVADLIDQLSDTQKVQKQGVEIALGVEELCKWTALRIRPALGGAEGVINQPRYLTSVKRGE